LQATTLVIAMLRRRVENLRARLVAEATVLVAHQASADPRLLILDTGMPWKNADLSMAFQNESTTSSPAPHRAGETRLHGIYYRQRRCRHLLHRSIDLATP
jgi:hypothetical protein